MDESIRDLQSQETLAEAIAGWQRESDRDMLPLDWIDSALRYGFQLKGEVLEATMRHVLTRLMALGTRPVIGGVGRRYEWLLSTEFGRTNEEILEGLMALWREADPEDWSNSYVMLAGEADRGPAIEDLDEEYLHETSMTFPSQEKGWLELGLYDVAEHRIALTRTHPGSDAPGFPPEFASAGFHSYSTYLRACAGDDREASLALLIEDAVQLADRTSFSFGAVVEFLAVEVGFAGDELTNASRRVLQALLDGGALPVVRRPGTLFVFLAEPRYGRSTPDILDAMMAESLAWRSLGEPWSAQPHAFELANASAGRGPWLDALAPEDFVSPAAAAEFAVPDEVRRRRSLAERAEAFLALRDPSEPPPTRLVDVLRPRRFLGERHPGGDVNLRLVSTEKLQEISDMPSAHFPEYPFPADYPGCLREAWDGTIFGMRTRNERFVCTFVDILRSGGKEDLSFLKWTDYEITAPAEGAPEAPQKPPPLVTILAPLDAGMIDRFHRVTLDDYLAGLCNGLALDAVGFWQVVAFLREGFGLAGEALDTAVRSAVTTLVDYGARPATGAPGFGEAHWRLLPGYGDTASQVVETVMAQWLSDRDPQPAILWFDLPDYAVAADESSERRA